MPTDYDQFKDETMNGSNHSDEQEAVDPELVRQAAQMEAAMSEVQDRIEEQARKQNRWIETQIWTTDYSEVAVLDVVTFQPRSPMEEFDIKAYRYPSEDDAPDELEFYAQNSGMKVEVRRITREEFREVVEESDVSPPPYVDEPEVWDGEHGADEGMDDVEERLQELREERRDL